MGQRWAQTYFGAANVAGLCFNAVVLSAKFAGTPSALSLVDIHTSAVCVASFSLVLCVAGIVLACLKQRHALAVYAFGTLVVISFYTYVIVLCFIAPNEVPVGRVSARVMAGAGVVVCLLTAPCVYVAAVLAGRAWTARSLGASCSATTLAVTCALMAFGAKTVDSGASASVTGVVIAAAVFKMIDCLVGIPMFVFQWQKVLKAHTVWSVLSAIMLIVGASAALAADNVYVFTTCKTLSPPPVSPLAPSPQPPSPAFFPAPPSPAFFPAPPNPVPFPLPPSPELFPPPPSPGFLPPPPSPEGFPPPPSPEFSPTPLGRKLLMNVTELMASPTLPLMECAERELAMMGALAAVTLVVSCVDIACSVVLLLKKNRRQAVPQKLAA
jgi:hypothetical protein